MTEEEVPPDPSVPETLGGTLGAVPPPPRPSEESAVFTDASRDLRDAGGPQEPRLARFVGWVRWAAAPLGFFVFLAALTAFGLLKDDEPATDVGDEPAANVVPATPAPTIPETVVTTEVPTTVAEPPTTVTPPPTEPPPTQPPPTEPPAPPPAASPSRSSEPAKPAAASRFGPSCGYRPGQTVRITINGRPAGTAIADGRGCVTVR